MEMPDWKYWLYRKYGIDVDNLDVREVLNDNPLFVYIGAGVLVFFALTLVVCQFTGGVSGGFSGSYNYKLVYYDVNAKTLHVMAFDGRDGQAALIAPNERGRYQAVIYTCKENPTGLIKDGMPASELEKHGLFIAWLQKQDTSMQGNGPQLAEVDVQMRTLDNEMWVHSYSPESSAIFNAPNRRCKEAMPYIAW